MPTVNAHLMFEFFLGAILFASGAAVAYRSMRTDATRDAYWASFTRNMGYGLLNNAVVYLVFQDLLSVKNVPGVLAFAAAATVMWWTSVRREFSWRLVVVDMGRIGRLVFTYSIAGFIAQQSQERLLAAGLGYVLFEVCIFLMNHLSKNDPLVVEEPDTDGGMGA
jgi:hypothetical protein